MARVAVDTVVSSHPPNVYILADSCAAKLTLNPQAAVVGVKRVIVTPPRALLSTWQMDDGCISSVTANVLCSSNSEKQAAQSWGANEGEAELKDEQAAAEIAESEQKAEGEAAAEGEAKEEEPEDKSVAYTQFILEQEAKKKEKAFLSQTQPPRPPNEGVNDDKWKGFTPLSKDDNLELFAGTGGKAKRERERKTKQFVELENRYIEPERTRGGRGGRGDARGEGGRGRGDSGRGRGRGAPRGEFRGAPRGEFRGGRGGRGGRGQDSQPLNPSDENAFPSLGGKN